MLDAKIINVKIIDGTAVPAYLGSVGIQDGKLVCAPDPGEAAKTIIDGAGRYLTPGFIDSHSHTDRYLGSKPETISLCKISQGITTEMTGQCGSSCFPVPSARKDELYALLQDDLNEEQLASLSEFSDFETYLHYLEKQSLIGNFAFLMGHGTLRGAVMGTENRAPTPAELDQMKQLLAHAMQHGCFGLSSGLIYLPGVYAKTDEMLALCEVMQPYGGIYATHLRSESDHIVEAVKEAIGIAKAARVPLVLSHHKVCGVQNYGKSAQTLALVEQAIAEGMSITLDQYPYEASQTGLCQCINPARFSQGLAHLAQQLKDPAVRAQVKAEILESPPRYNNSYRNANGFDGILVLSSPNCPEAEGKTLTEWAAYCGQDPFEAYFDLMVATEGNGSGAFFCVDKAEIERIYQYPHTVVGTDGLVGKDEGPVHPRAYGSLVRSLVWFVKEKQLLPLEQAVYKQTLLTATRWGIPHKGRIADGYDADLVLLDWDALQDNADFFTPRALCSGIDMVWVNGKLAYQAGAVVPNYSGRAVLHTPLKSCR